MKAIQVSEFGGPEVLQVAELPAPEPGKGQVAVRLHAIGVNPVDTYVRSGTYAQKPRLPYTPGVDGAGTIVRVGAAAGGLAPGQRVYVAGSLSGTYAEETLCAAEQVHTLPEHVSFEQGAALGVPYTTAAYALFHRAHARPPEIVLIHGATGGVGLAAVQLAGAAGLTVLGTGGTPEGRIVVAAHGAHAVFDHLDVGYVDAIRRETKNHGVDIVLEMLANVNLAKDLTLVAPFGRIAVIGSRGPIEINPREIMSRNADIRGILLFGAPAETVATIHRHLIEGLNDGTLSPVIGKTFPLDRAADAHTAIMSPGALGKIVLAI